jgi:hypothetical protein
MNCLRSLVGSVRRRLCHDKGLVFVVNSAETLHNVSGMRSETDAYSQYLNKIRCVEHVMQKALKFGALIVAAVLAAALNFTTMYTVAHATSGMNTTAVSNMIAGSTTPPSSCGSGSTASSCYDAGYQNALANPGKICPSGHSYTYCAGWAHAREKR